jgi:uncharacterized protein (DUF58 family)
VAPETVEMRSYRYTPARRGALEFVGFRVATRFPFGLFSKALWIDGPRSTLVFPALDAAPPALPRSGSLRRGAWRSSAAGQSPESAGLRAWAAGDPQRRVHWRASLRRGVLLVRDQEQEASGEHLVRLRTAGCAAGAAFEDAVRRAASDVAQNLRGGLRVALQTDAESFAYGEGTAHRRRLLSHLALVAPDPPPAPQRGVDAAGAEA